MDELIPVILAFVFGGLIWRTTTGRIRVSLSVATILTTALAATLVSGEFFRSWTYLLIDVSEAAAAFTCAVALESFTLRRNSVSTPPPSAKTPPWILVRRKPHDAS